MLYVSVLAYGRCVISLCWGGNVVAGVLEEVRVCQCQSFPSVCVCVCMCPLHCNPPFLCCGAPWQQDHSCNQAPEGSKVVIHTLASKIYKTKSLS